MNEVTRLDVDMAIAKLNALLAVLDNIRDSNAVWKDLEMIKRVERIWKSIEALQSELDESI